LLNSLPKYEKLLERGERFKIFYSGKREILEFNEQLKQFILFLNSPKHKKSFKSLQKKDKWKKKENYSLQLI